VTLRSALFFSCFTAVAAFAQQQPLTRTGCLLYKTNGFILQVDDSAEVLQLTGANLQTNLGNHVQITGVPAGSANINPATQTIAVRSVALQSAGGCLTAAAALTAQTTMPPAGAPAAPNAPASTAGPTGKSAPVAKSGGMSAGAKVAIVGAVAGGGAGAALALGGKKSTSPQ
jgi:hypothetical protein